MDEANRKASVAAFTHNNAAVEADFIDLHGLYVREAEAVRQSSICLCFAAFYASNPVSGHLITSGPLVCFQVTEKRIAQARKQKRPHLVSLPLLLCVPIRECKSLMG